MPVQIKRFKSAAKFLTPLLIIVLMSFIGWRNQLVRWMLTTNATGEKFKKSGANEAQRYPSEWAWLQRRRH